MLFPSCFKLIHGFWFYSLDFLPMSNIKTMEGSDSKHISLKHYSILRTKMGSHRGKAMAKQPFDFIPQQHGTNKNIFHSFPEHVCCLQSQAMFYWARAGTVSKQEGWSEEWELQTAYEIKVAMKICCFF